MNALSRVLYPDETKLHAEARAVVNALRAKVEAAHDEAIRALRAIQMQTGSITVSASLDAAADAISVASGYALESIDQVATDELVSDEYLGWNLEEEEASAARHRYGPNPGDAFDMSRAAAEERL